MKNYIAMIMLIISTSVLAASEMEVIQEYPQTKITVTGLKEDVRGFLKIPIWSITYKLENQELEKINTKLGVMITQKCHGVFNVIKPGQTYIVNVKKVKKKHRDTVDYYYSINPRQLGISCPYSWDDI